jgi:hypothetical protein
MVISNAPHDLAKYEHVYSVRQSDGMRIVAKRIVADKHTPIRWEISVVDSGKSNDYTERSFFKGSEASVTNIFATSELLREAQKAGFGDWYPKQVGFRDSWPLDAKGDDSEKRLIPEYPLPDSTEYLVD